MRALIESYARLYAKGRIAAEYLKAKVTDGIITAEEYEQIIGETYD